MPDTPEMPPYWTDQVMKSLPKDGHSSLAATFAYAQERGGACDVYHWTYARKGE